VLCLLFCSFPSLFAANRIWTSSTPSNPNRTKWGASYSTNWASALVPTVNDIAVFTSQYNVYNQYNLSVQSNTVVGGVRFTGTNSYIMNGQMLGIGPFGITNQSGRGQTFASVNLLADQTWSGDATASIIVNNLELSGKALTSSSDVLINNLNLSDPPGSVTVAGGNTHVAGGGPATVGFTVSSGTLSTWDQSYGYGYDASLSDLTVTGTGTYNNTRIGSDTGETSWNHVAMTAGTIDLMGVGGSMITTGFTVSGGILRMYVGYDPVEAVFVNSTVHATDGAGQMAGPLSFGGTLAIDFSGAGSEIFSTDCSWTLFFGDLAGATNFSSVVLENADPASPYYGLTFIQDGSVFKAGPGTDGTCLEFQSTTGNLVVLAAPAVVTLSASGIAAISATLNGTVNPGGDIAAAWFQYGAGTNYGSSSATNSLAALNSVLSVSSLISGLAPGATYHCRLVASNSVGMVAGGDLIFVTAPADLTWVGSVNGDWDEGTANWQGGAHFNSGDGVRFDDSAQITSVNLTTNLTPGSLTVSNVSRSYTFSGPGSLIGGSALVKQGAGTLTLANSGTNTFSGGLAVSGGSLYLGSGGSGDVAVSAGATLVLGAGLANNLTLSNAVLGGSAGGIVLLSGTVTVPAGATNTIATTDPQNPDVLAALYFNGLLTGGGHLVIRAGTNTTANADNTTASCRFTNRVDGGFTGTIEVGNRVKAEIKMPTNTFAFSPVGTATLILDGGQGPDAGLNGNNDGTYCNLLLRNDSGGDAQFGNNMVMAGSGFAALNPLGLSPEGSKTILGNLTIGGGQTLGVYRTGGPTNGVFGISSGLGTQTNMITLRFPTVTLTGGSATLSPRPAGFAANVGGSDLELGDIAELAPSSLVLDGQRTLAITGTDRHTGTTTVSSGTLNVTGTLGGGAVSVAGGTLAGSGAIQGPVTILSGGTLDPGAVIAGHYYQSASYGIGTLCVSNSLTLQGNVTVEVAGQTNDAVRVTGGLTYGGTLTVTNLGGVLSAGAQFAIFPVGGLGNFTAILGSPGSGLVWQFAPSNGVLSVVAVQPVSFNLTSSSQISGGGFQLSFTNLPGLGFTVLGSTNLTLPVSEWIVLGAPVENPPGTYQFTDAQVTNSVTRFYRVRSEP